MEGYSRNGDYYCPKLLDLLQKQNREWCVREEEEVGGEERDGRVSDEKKLELSLGPPGGGGGGGGDGDGDGDSEGDGWSFKNGGTSKNHINRDEKNKSLVSLNGYFSNTQHNFSSSSSPSSSSPFLQLQPSPRPKESSTQAQQHKGGFSPTNTAVTNAAHKRTAPAPVVGWPPVRSFRKNLTSSSNSSSCLKLGSSDPANLVPTNKVDTNKVIEKNSSKSQQGKFVKINMEGIPIGRKVDLAAYDTYDKLSSAVDDLFRGLLAVQSDAENKEAKDRKISGLLDGSGEYTLVYEDNEGDRMLVGDVPWHMFVSTVRRLRVLKSSELAMFSRGAKQGKALT